MIYLVNKTERNFKIGLIMFVIGFLILGFVLLPQFSSGFSVFNPFNWIGILKEEAFKLLMGFFGFLLAFAGTIRMIFA